MPGNTDNSAPDHQGSANRGDSPASMAEPAATLSAQQVQDLVRNIGVLAAALANQQNAPPAPANSNKTSLQHPERPRIDLNSTESKWAFFKSEWALYKRRANLTNSCPEELRACCSEELRHELFNYIGPTTIDTLDEGKLLDHIKRLSVKGKNTAVHRQEFYALQQAPDTPAQQYVAQLRAKAEHCNFVVKCPGCENVVTYAGPMISDQLTVGLTDKDIQGEILAKDNQLDTFEKKLDLVQSLEDGKRAREELSLDSTIAAHQSKYQKQRRNQPRNSSHPNDVSECSGCGSKDHGKGTGKSRNQHCPARSQKCDHCGIIGHFSNVCRKKNSAAPTSQSASPHPKGSHSNTMTHAEDDNSTWFTSYGCIDEFTHSSLMANKAAWSSRNHPLSQSSKTHKRVIVPHMEWVDSIGRFAHRHPPSLPSLPVSVQILHDTHAAFHCPLSCQPRDGKGQGIITAIADTGAQTCACGPDVLRKLGISESVLVPTSHSISGVTSSSVDITGVLFAALNANGKTSKQVIYVARNITGLFISMAALQELNCIPATFPTPEISTLNISTSTCDCPTRESVPPRPKTVPYTPTKDNVKHLEKWILKYYASSAFNICEHQALPYMSGNPLEIHFKPDVKPVAHHTPIPVPHHWKSKVKADLDRDVRLGIIEPVPPGTPTVWCSRMVVVPKKDGTPRRTVDLQALNAATYRLTHHTASPFNQAALVPPHTWKTTLDAWNGYHSMRLDPGASTATTFITEWGRYRYLRAPQGSHVAGDGYTKAYDDFTIDVPRKTKCIDDSLLWDTNIEGCFWHTVDYITLCARNGVVFNPSKFQFARDEIEFAGFNITWTGLKPSTHLLEAIKDFPKPQNITDARSWFGLVNQVAYSISSSETMQPFRDLLKPGKWYWDDALNTAFESSKLAILRMIEQGVRSFEPQRPTCLATDWSKTGIGFILLQKHCRCPMASAPVCCPQGWRLIFAGSRFTSDAESRYAPIEGEALAVAYALDKCRMYVLGCPNLLVATDHQPLTTILGDSHMENIKNPRLFRLKEKTLLYDFSIKHIPGTWQAGPDACSRTPRPSPTSVVSYLCENIMSKESEYDPGDSTALTCITDSLQQCTLNAIYNEDDTHVTAITLARVREIASKDESYSLLCRYIQDGFPSRVDQLPASVQPYWKIRNQLTCLDGVCLYENRIVIPPSLRKVVLDCLHAAHQGVAGMKARANRSVYWPGIGAAISSRRAQCRSCNKIAPSQPAEPMTPSPAPSFPFERVVADHFHLQGHQYLLYADRYTGWVTIAKCDPLQNNASSLRRELRTLFGIYGAPVELATDGGQPFASHSVQHFLKQWGVSWRVSSAYYAQSNGRAEVAVKTAKRLLLDNMTPTGGLDTDRFARALLQYRNTPLPGIGTSPAQLLYGRTLRDHIPSLHDVLRIRKEWVTLAEDRERALARRHLSNIERYNSNTRALPSLKVGDSVLVQNQCGNHPLRWDKTGRIVEIRDHSQYVVRMDGSGRCSLRNRRFLRLCLPFCTDSQLPRATTNEPQTNIQPTSTEPTLPQKPQPNTMVPNPDSETLNENTRTDDATMASDGPDIHEVVINDSGIDGATDRTADDTTSTPQPINYASHQANVGQNQSQTDLSDNPRLRRSTRQRRRPQELSLTLHGKSHGYVRR